MKRPSSRRTQEDKRTHEEPTVGLVEWFRPGEFERVERVVEDIRTLGVKELRVGVSWADWYSSEGDGWYAWLLPTLAREVNVLPTFVYTPPCLGIVPKFSSPPEVPKHYADFIDVMITRFGSHFEWLQLWDQPDEQSYWDSRLDADAIVFCEMIGGAAYWAHQRGRKTVLPGVLHSNARWLQMMDARGVLPHIDAIGLYGFPSATELPRSGWEVEVDSVREVLSKLGSNPAVWIAATGFSTWRGDERAQSRAFVDAIDAPVERVYWKELQDREPVVADSFNSDEREKHYGLKRGDGAPKLLYSAWAKGGLDEVRKSVRQTPSRRKSNGAPRPILITGGAGFIGTNLAGRLLSAGRPVLIYDDLSRPGVEGNLNWLTEQYGDLVRVEIADIRDRQTLRRAVQDVDGVFHFAAQVAVTTSLTDPRRDFEINVGGTLNLLEAMRSLETPPPLLFTSTNKVYGSLSDLPLEKNGTRYQPLDTSLRTGVSEDRRLDFHSPYGCSKGAADQYVLDYARTFGLPAVVFRMSCIYGLHQMGTEDQGWVAHFLIRAIHKKPLVLYGDGLQVRDILFVEDLVDAFLLAHANMHTLSGEAFNIGGGLGNTLSLRELIDMIEAIDGRKVDWRVQPWRCADQRYYVSDTRKFKSATGWSPKVNARQGVERLYRWLLEQNGQPMPPAPGFAGRGSGEWGGGVYAVLPH
jgi:CDP-paratose 2-epimerase